MDAINKFIGLRPTISPEPQETQAAPEQASKPSSNAGIADAPDTFEAFQPKTFELPHLTTPLTGDTGSSNPSPPPQGETVEPSSFFDLITADSGAAKLQGSVIPSSDKWGIKDPGSIDPSVLDGPGSVRWDAIESLKLAMTRQDAMGIIQILQKLRPNDLALTLAAIAKQGTPSELQLMVDRICTNPEAMGMMGPLLATLA